MSAPFWFLGMEPVDARAGIAERVVAWERLGEPAVADRGAFYQELVAARAVKLVDRFEPVSAALVTMLFAAQRRAAYDDERDAYVRTRFGRAGDETAVLDVVPLPLHRGGNWVAHEVSSDIAYRSRTAYVATFAPQRVHALRAAVARERPALVVAYGNVHAGWWSMLAGGAFAVESDVSLRHRRAGDTLFVQVPHPLASGTASDANYRAIGEFIGERLQPEPRR